MPLTPEQKQKIVKEWIDNLKSDNPLSKTKFAEKHNTSPRSLGRMLQAADAPIVVKKTPVAKPKQEVKAAPEPVQAQPDTVPAAEPETPDNAPEETQPETTPESPTVDLPPNEEPLPAGTGIVKYTVDEKRFISVLLTDGETLVVEPENHYYKDIAVHLALSEYDQAVLKMSRKRQLLALKIEGFTIDENGVHLNNKDITNAVADEITNIFCRNEDPTFLVRFLDKVIVNPSKNVYDNLFKMLKQSGVAINAEGNVECFKVIRNDYTDKHTGTYDNSIGTTVKMLRQDVVEDPNQHCSAGLHVCAPDYIKSFSRGDDRLVLVEVDPRDFVSVPNDYNFTKARTCRYKVLCELDPKTKEKL